jgi:uncharacterized protein (TIGR03790 family)
MVISACSQDRVGGAFGPRVAAIAVGVCLVLAISIRAEMAPDQVLILYKSSAGSEATTLKDAYLDAHPDIPAANVLDLDNAFLLDRADLTYSEYKTHIRDPIRDYLSLPGPPNAEDIIAMVIIRPLPHRLLDTDNALIGDNPGGAGNEFNGGDATYASIDAELVLLWQDLDSGEAGGQMDSPADNVIDNPYHASSTSISAFSRSAIETQKTFNNYYNVAWSLGGSGQTRLTPGDMYLVCRIDGNSLADAEAMIQRAQDLYVNKAIVRIILDEYDVSGGNDLDDDGLGALFPARDDYEEARDDLVAAAWDVRYDGTADFISSDEETMPIIAYASYGENHGLGGENPPGNGTYIEGFDFPPGAIFNTIESYNGRALNGLGTKYNQEQMADFVTAGGTLAIGHVFEPFTFSIPDNEYLVTRMLVQQMCWAEAAYSSLPALSWQHIVLGDPLAKAAILDDPGLPLGDLNGDTRADGLDVSIFAEVVLEGLSGYRAAYPTLDPIARADFNGDYQVTILDTPGFVAALLGS